MQTNVISDTKYPHLRVLGTHKKHLKLSPLLHQY
jgi:hypothetical protein